LREGSYAINLAQFIVLTMDSRYTISLEANDEGLFEQTSGIIAQRNGFEPVVIKDADDVIGIITVHDGPALPEGEIIAPTVGQEASRTALFHNNFQDPENFCGQQAFAVVNTRYWWTVAII